MPRRRVLAIGAIVLASHGLLSAASGVRAAEPSDVPAPAPVAAGSPFSAASPAGSATPSSTAASPTHVPFAATSRHPFDDVAHWSSVFDDPARDAWQKPHEVLRALDLRPGMTVADLGAGTGYFSRYLSAAVGTTGTVFAADTEPNLVARLRERAEQEQTANVTPVLASFDDPRLPAGALDLVLIVDTFHHLDARLEYLRRLRRTLKPHGRVAIVDWQAVELPIGPPVEHKLPREQVIAEMQAAGYRLVAEPRILPYQYLLVFAAA